jgi:hypothetical protein
MTFAFCACLCDSFITTRISHHEARDPATSRRRRSLTRGSYRYLEWTVLAVIPVCLYVGIGGTELPRSISTTTGRLITCEAPLTTVRTSISRYRKRAAMHDTRCASSYRKEANLRNFKELSAHCLYRKQHSTL